MHVFEVARSVGRSRMPKFDVFVPDNLESALEFLQNPPPDTMLIANGTDLINRIRRRQVHPKVLVDLTGLTEFKYVKRDGDRIRIGALTTLNEVAESEILNSNRYEVFSQVIAKFGAPNITNMATIGGNICAASSSEDFLPVFLVFDASVKLRSKRGERTVELAKFLVEKRQTDLRPNEILAEVSFPVMPDNAWCSFDKIGMRNSLIIAFVNIAVYIALDKRTKAVEVARVAFNRVRGKIPERAQETEKALQGKRIDEAVITKAMETLSSELRLKSDFRVTGEYREQVARVFFRRVLLHCLANLETN
jgi:carbon-monoxide dehydrogenase medium subunit